MTEAGAGRIRISRRHLIGMMAGVGAAAVMPGGSLAAVGAGERRLTLHHMHTTETVSAPYWADGAYVPDTLAAFNRLLRDYHTEAVTAIDPTLFDFVHALVRRLGHRGEVGVICGYRSPQTNAMLRRTGTDAAKRSLHLEGRAVDLRLPGRRATEIARAAWSLQRGGVGTYSRENFVHLDVGAVRRWGS